MATHQFEPDHYFSTIGSHPPVLRVQPGDSVETTTVDARGPVSYTHLTLPTKRIV